MSDVQNATLELLAHLRGLRESCAKGMAWCSALIWAEKVFLLSGDTDDLLWLADALVTNGQFRQAEEWLLNPLYAARCRSTPEGRHLASVVSMRLGRAEEALELLSIDTIRPSGAISNRRSSDLRYERPPVFETPVTAKKMFGNGHETPTVSLVSSLSISEQDSAITAASTAQKMDTSSTTHQCSKTSGKASVPPINPRAWMLYMQGAAVVQLANVGGNEDTPGIKALSMRYPDTSYGLRLGSSQSGLTPGVPSTGKPPMQCRAREQVAQLGTIDSLVARLWIEALRADPRCWEAWSGIHEYGLLTSEEESQLIEGLDWLSSCAGSHAAANFFRDYCMATRTSFSLGSGTVGATERLLSAYPQLIVDPALRTIQAARLLALGCARESLEYTVNVLEQRRVPDPSATAIHITSLTVLHAKDALFRIAHELAEEFGISSIKRAEIEPADTVSPLAPITPLGSTTGSFGGSVGIPMSIPRGSAIGAAVSGAGRVRAGARGILIPETPSKGGAGSGMGSNVAATAGSLRRVGSSFQGAANSVVQSASSAATAAWRGLWGLPTWTHPGPPVMATYPCALGPTQSSAVSTEMSMSTLGTFTTTNAQSVGSPTQYEFIGASLAWYAIGCYYLVSATLMTLPGVSQQEWPLAGMTYGTGFAAPTSGHIGVGDAAATLRRSVPLSAEGEHALAEARRWLAKTTLASPRSIVAWVAFAHTFIISREWESATRALHTAVGLCGCEGIIHSGGRDSASATTTTTATATATAISSTIPLQTPSKRVKRPENTLFFETDSNTNNRGGETGRRIDGSDFERGSLLAHAPLASLGSVYLRMGDLAMAESCFDASARCLSGQRISDWLSAWKPTLESLENSDILEWCADEKRVSSDETGKLPASQTDPQLLNDVGVLYYSSGDYVEARLAFVLALSALHAKSRMQRSLHMAFIHPSSARRAHTKLSPELKAYLALLSANLGNTLRKLGDYNAALICLRSAAELAPYSMGIQLSVGFTLHQRAIACHPDPSYDSNFDLDQAIDIYHRILAEHPGDPVTTDLLTLGLELSNSLQDIPSLSNILGIGGLPELGPETFELKDPAETGLFGPLDNTHGDDPAGSHASSRHSVQVSESADESQELSHSAASDEAEDSDEVMDIEEGSDEHSGSDSDMAMD